MHYEGIVQKASERARALGYPTVNIVLSDEKVSGVYVARVKVGEEEYEAVVFADTVRKVLEAHLFDFSADLYGWNIRIELLKKIRGRKHFADDAAAHRAIAEDVRVVRQYFDHER